VRFFLRLLSTTTVTHVLVDAAGFLCDKPDVLSAALERVLYICNLISPKQQSV
jgi:hypothetical protein